MPNIKFYKRLVLIVCTDILIEICCIFFKRGLKICMHYCYDLKENLTAYRLLFFPSFSQLLSYHPNTNSATSFILPAPITTLLHFAAERQSKLIMCIDLCLSLQPKYLLSSSAQFSSIFQLYVPQESLGKGLLTLRKCL